MNYKMNYYRNVRKIIAVLVMGAFLFQADLFLNARPQSEDEVVSQFHRARDRYNSGQYVNAKTRIERIISIINGIGIERNDILGQCYLLLGAIYEKESKPLLAKENYRKAKETYGIMLVDEVDLEALDLYRKVVKGVGVQPPEPTANGTIAKEGKKKKKKFPWLLVAGGVVVITVVLILLLKKKKYTLTVNRGDGVEGDPTSNSYTYKKGEQVSYSYQARSGYGNLSVTLDGAPVSASGSFEMTGNRTLTATTEPQGFITNKDTMEIQEDTTAEFTVRLATMPQEDVNVAVGRVDAPDSDPDIQVVSNAILTFTTENWDDDQIVRVKANEDSDSENGSATIRISAPNIPDKDITATEIDTTQTGFEVVPDDVTITEGGTAQFRVWLKAKPSETINATVGILEGGDPKISITSRKKLAFTPDDYDEKRTVELAAAYDETDVENGTATVRISAPDLPDFPHADVIVTEIDRDTLNFITDPNELTIIEGNEGSFKLHLSQRPPSDVSVNITRITGSSTITVTSGSPMTFTRLNWNTPQKVIFHAAGDDDAVNDQATFQITGNGVANRNYIVKEDDITTINFITDTDSVTVPEGGTAGFMVKLSAKPGQTVEVSAFRKDGDEDIDVAAGTRKIYFNSTNYNDWQSVNLEAAGDEDEANGTATIRIDADIVTTKDITATESDSGGGEPPKISFDEPGNGDTVSDDVDIWALADDDFGIEKVEFYIDNSLEHTINGDNSSYYYSWSTKEIDAGDHIIKVIAYDAVHQASEEITVTVADNPPTVEITPPSSSPLTGTVPITIKAEDYKGVKTVKLYLDDTLIHTWADQPNWEVEFTFDLDTTAYANGSHTLKAIAVDTGDQESTASEASITIQN